MGKRSNTPRECVLCGKLAELTTDHIPPRCMFPRGAQLITIPVCLTCNSAASKDDEYFRAALALRREAESNPVVQELLPRVLRGLTRSGARGTTGSIVTSFRDVDLYSAGGIYVGKGASYSPEDPRISRVAGRIVRGLYFREFGARLPSSHGVDTYTLANFNNDPTTLTSVSNLSRFATTETARVVHKDVFVYAFRALPDKPGACIFVMTFYASSAFLAITLDRSDYRGSRPLV